MVHTHTQTPGITASTDAKTNKKKKKSKSTQDTETSTDASNDRNKTQFKEYMNRQKLVNAERQQFLLQQKVEGL